MWGFMEPAKNRVCGDFNSAMVERWNQKRHRAGETLPPTPPLGLRTKRGIAKTNLDIEGKPSLRCMGVSENDLETCQIPKFVANSRCGKV